MGRLIPAAALLAAAVTSTAVGAQGTYAPGYAPRSGDRALPAASPDQIVRSGIDRLTGFLIGTGDPSPTALRTFLEHQIAPYFDFDYMAQWAAGAFLHRLSEDQRARLSEKLRALFLDALARNLGTYARPLPRVDVFPARPGRTPAEATVNARVASTSGVAVLLEFRFYWDGAGWRIYDVTANGASAVAFYRGYFGNSIRRHGPDAALK